MITLPKHVIKKEHITRKSLVMRCYGEEEIVLDNNDDTLIKSRNPFIIEHNGKRIMLTSSQANVIPDNCQYALLVNRKPSVPLFKNKELRFDSWLKHPAMNDVLTSNEVAHSWRGKFTFVEEDKEANIGGLRRPQSGSIHAWLSSQHTRKD